MSDAIMGTFVRIQTMSDGAPRIILDLTCSLSDVAAMGLTPGAPFAIARLNPEATTQHAQKEAQEPKEKPGQLCVMACNFCADPAFHDFLCVASENEAKWKILDKCKIQSRRELDTNKQAAEIFHKEFRQRFLWWKDAKD